VPAGWLERHGILSHLQAIENGAFDRVEWTFDKDEEDAADAKDAVVPVEQLLESRRVVRIFCIVGALADAICK